MEIDYTKTPQRIAVELFNDAITRNSLGGHFKYGIITMSPDPHKTAIQDVIHEIDSIISDIKSDILTLDNGFRYSYNGLDALDMLTFLSEVKVHVQLDNLTVE